MSPKAVIRIGRGADCDVRFDNAARHDGLHQPRGDPLPGRPVRGGGRRIDQRHAAQRQAGPHPRAPVGRQDRLRRAGRSGGALRDRGELPLRAGQRAAAAPLQTPIASVRRPPPPPPVRAPSQDAAALAREAQLKVSQARARVRRAGLRGRRCSSWPTPCSGWRRPPRGRTGRRAAGSSSPSSLLSLAGFGALGLVIWQQKKQIEEIVHKKDNLDRQIARLQIAMQVESDPEKLAVAGGAAQHRSPGRRRPPSASCRRRTRARRRRSSSPATSWTARSGTSSPSSTRRRTPCRPSSRSGSSTTSTATSARAAPARSTGASSSTGR